MKSTEQKFKIGLMNRVRSQSEVEIDEWLPHIRTEIHFAEIRSFFKTVYWLLNPTESYKILSNNNRSV